MDLTDALDRFLAQLRADGRSSHTLGQYRRHIRLVASWAVSEGLSGDVSELDHEDLARFLGSDAALTGADGRRKKATSVNALRSSLKGFFRYLHRAGHLTTDPSRLIRAANCGTPPPRGVSDSDQARLLAILAEAKGEAAERDHVLFRFLLATGSRVSAALAVQVEDVDLERGEVLLRRTKGDRAERVFLPAAVQKHFARYLDGRTRGPVFPGKDGGPIAARHAHRRLRNWLEKAGASPASPHALRHAFAMALYRRTRDLLLVRRALGHRSLASTLRYATAQDEELREVMRTA